MTPDRTHLDLHLRAFLEQGLILDPWLAGLSSECFSFEGLDRLVGAATELAAEHWHEPLIAQTLGTLPAHHSLALRAVKEILSSSSAVIAHEQFGHVAVDLAIVDEAIRRTERFVGRHGLGPLVRIFVTITGFDSRAAVVHSGDMSEEAFVSGALHRPWANGTLGDELLAGLAGGSYRLQVDGGRRTVAVTRRGSSLQAEALALLTHSGYLESRLRLTWLSHANLRAAAEDPALGLWPPESRRPALTRFARVRAGMDVLDAGCGAGSQIFAGGLWSAVGPDGTVTGLDPAAALVARARQESLARAAPNVTMVQGRVEAMPFMDGQFDASIAVGLLEYTDYPTAMAEIVRVTRAGGLITIAGAAERTFDRATLREWFQPLLRLARRYGIDPADRVSVYGRLAAVFARANLRNVEITHEATLRILSDADRTVDEMVRGSGFVQRVLERVPWGARHEVIQELVVRGRLICATTPPEQRTVTSQIHVARGTVTTAR